ncbi:MAG: hypothetical protein ACK5Y2_09060 [Bdellovibrionales bacterium]
MRIWFTLVFFVTVAAWGESSVYRRLVNFEWEPVEEAKYYEIEIRKKGPTKSTSFTTTSAEWNGRLQIGRYEFRLRTLGKRKIPGEWSGYSDLDVGLEPVKALTPAPEAQVKGADAETHEVEFSWSPTPAATGYSIEVLNEKNEKVFEDKVSGTSVKKSLPVATRYTWTGRAISAEGLESEALTQNPFVVVGPKLEKPKIEKPDHEFIRELKWEPSTLAESYDVILARYNPQIKKWQKFKEFENLTQTSLNFEQDWPGGQYRLIVKSKAAIRDPSELSAISFAVRQGDRSPAAEYVHTLRKSIDRFNGWFAHASWFASSISMSSQYRNSVGFETEAITGTGRFGMGWIKPDSDWGFLALGDVSGFVFDNRVYSFVGFEVCDSKKSRLGSWRSSLSSRCLHGRISCSLDD